MLCCVTDHDNLCVQLDQHRKSSLLPSWLQSPMKMKHNKNKNPIDARNRIKPPHLVLRAAGPPAPPTMNHARNISYKSTAGMMLQTAYSRAVRSKSTATYSWNIGVLSAAPSHCVPVTRRKTKPSRFNAQSLWVSALLSSSMLSSCSWGGSSSAPVLVVSDCGNPRRRLREVYSMRGQETARIKISPARHPIQDRDWDRIVVRAMVSTNDGYRGGL